MRVGGESCPRRRENPYVEKFSGTACRAGGVIFILKRTKLGTKLPGRVSLQKHSAHPHYDLSENS